MNSTTTATLFDQLADLDTLRNGVAWLILETRTRKNAIAPMTQAELFEEAA
jgi:hypothetical protein